MRENPTSVMTLDVVGGKARFELVCSVGGKTTPRCRDM